MQIQVLLFGIVADLIGASSIDFEITSEETVFTFKKKLAATFPQLNNYASFAVAVNETYSLDDVLVKNGDIIALIPPVSGG